MGKPDQAGLIAISSVVLYVAIGVAVWWKTTEISRPEMPLEALWAAPKSVASAQPALPVGFTFYALAADDQVSIDGDSWVSRLHSKMAAHMGLSPEVAASKLSVQLTINTPLGTCHHHSQGPTNHNTTGLCLALDGIHAAGSQPQLLDEFLHTQLTQHGAALPGSYTVFLLPDPSLTTSPVSNEAPLIMGQHRHAWVTYPALAFSSAAGGTGLAAVLDFLEAAVEPMTSAFHLRSGVTKAQLPLSAAGELQLSFSLCNADPTSAAFSWDFDALEEQYLQPLVEALAPVAKVSVSSQILHYTEAAVTPEWSHDDSAYVITHQQLPYFVDSHWNLESGGPAVIPKGEAASGGVDGAGDSSETPSEGIGMHIPSHLLHFVVYIPPPEHRPLRLQLRNGSLSSTNSFWIPSWGGVVILDPPDSPNQILTQEESRIQSSVGSLPTGSTAPLESEDSSSVSGQDLDSTTTSTSSPAQQSDAQAPVSEDPPPESQGVQSAEEVQAGGMQRLPPSALHHITQIVVSQVHSLFGLPAFKPLLPPRSSTPSYEAKPAGTSEPESATERDAAEAASTGSPTGGQSSTGSKGAGGVGNLKSLTNFKLRAAHLPAESTGLATWQLEALLRQRTTANLAAASQMLSSLATAVRDLPNLEMPDLIGTHVSQALQELATAVAAAETGQYHVAAAAAQSARTHAQSAYLHPAVLAQLNFPESHKLGIYIPYFMPVGVAVLRGVLKEVAAMRARARGTSMT